MHSGMISRIFEAAVFDIHDMMGSLRLWALPLLSIQVGM